MPPHSTVRTVVALLWIDEIPMFKELLWSSADYLSTSTTRGVRQSEIGSWSCQLRYLHPSWVLTLLTKRDLYFRCRQPPFFSRSSFHINVWAYEGRGGIVTSKQGCVKVKLDRGRVNCGTFILRGCWLFWQNEILTFTADSLHSSADHLSTSTCESRKGRGNRDIQADKGGASKWNWIVVVSTAVPSSFVGVDSFDKMRS